MTSKFFYRLNNTLSEVPIKSGSADFRLLDKKVVEVCKAITENELFWRGLIPWLGFKTQFIPLETHGIMPSILRCYEHGRDYGKEIVYFAQDDYLYDTTALHDMIQTMMFTSYALGNFTSIYPYDDPYKYIPENTAVLSHIIRRQGRHWRTLPMTASCFMTHHKVITDNWDLFEAMGKHEVTSKMEDNTINQLFRTRNYYLFVPIPSLALHMQYDTEEDDQINWREWWDRYDRPEPLQPTTDNTVLNVGFGGMAIKDLLYTEVFDGMREISLDIDNKFNYYSLNDFSAAIGLVSKKLHFKYGSEGVFKRFKDKKTIWHDIPLEIGLLEGLKIFGFDMSLYNKIKSPDDIVNFIASSPLTDDSFFKQNLFNT